jgi:nicotinamidase-related amidase
MVRGLDAGQRAALVISECQRGVLDPSIAIFPGLADQAAARDIVGKIERLAAAFRAAGFPVVHVHAAHREDFGGVVPNSLISARSKKMHTMVEGTPAVEPVEGAIPEPSDYVSGRIAGIGMWYGTSLDSTLRNNGVSTVVLCGVSTNLALFAGSVGAVDRGYSVVLPEDATAGATPEQHEWMVTNTLPLLAAMSTADEVIAAIQ